MAPAARPSAGDRRLPRALHGAPPSTPIVPERRVLFSDDVEPVVAQPKKKLTNAEREEAARVEFTDKVREETGAILSPEWRVKWVSIGGAN